jgi:cysteine desulfuration protein SufE
MSTIRQIQDQLIEDFAFLEDWEDKYALLIAMGKELSPMPEGAKSEQNLIRGCQSKVWLTAQLQDGKVHFEADSDAFISKGMVALLVKIYQHQKPVDILNEKLDVIEKIGLQDHLSPNRANGLASMLKQMQQFALVFQAQNQIAG